MNSNYITLIIFMCFALLGGILSICCTDDGIKMTMFIFSFFTAIISVLLMVEPANGQ